MTTKQAFEKLLKDGSSKVNQSTFRSWKRRHKVGGVTIAAMESALKKAGAIKTPEHWTFRK